MAERVILCICLLLTPLLVWGAGMLLKRTPPGRPNGVYGYRTRRSGKSQAAWEFAQKKSAEVMTRCGRWMLLLSLAACGIFWEHLDAAATVLGIVQVAVLVCCILPVELALRRNFDEEGRPIERGEEL